MRRLLGICLVIAACTDGSTSPKSAEAGKVAPAVTPPDTKALVPPPPKRSFGPDMPSRTACTHHDQCRIETVLPSDDPCCEMSTLAPATVAYLEYVESYREIHCEGVVCAPMELPGPMPNECAMVGRCLAGQCGMGCDDPEYMRTQGQPQ